MSEQKIDPIRDALQTMVDRFGPCENEYVFSKRSAIQKGRSALENNPAPADTIVAQPIERRQDWVGTQDAMARGYVKIEAREPNVDERAAAEAEYARIYTGGGGGGRFMFVRGWQARAALIDAAMIQSPAGDSQLGGAA